MNLNKVFVLGNLTRDPEIRNLPSGQLVANFGIATNRFYTQEGEKKQETEFHNIVAFGKSAEIVSQYLKKGSLVLIEGRLRTRSWDDASSGAKKFRTEIIVERLQLGPRTGFGDSRKSGERDQGSDNKKYSQEDIPVIEEGDNGQKEKDKKEKKSKKEDDNIDEEEKEIDVSDIPF
jgi:single-strand DNA-binding protein